MQLGMTLRRILAVACPICLLAACSTPVDPVASVPGTEAPNVRVASSAASGNTALVTEMAMGLFFATCMRSPTDEARVREWLQANGFRPAPPALAASFLRGTPGTAWLRSDPVPVAIPLAVVTRSGGSQCEVMAPVADPDAAAARFRGLMERLAPPGLVVEKEIDESSAPGGGPGHFLLYRVGVPPVERGGVYFAMSARPPVPNGLALFMNAGRAAPR